MDLGSVFDEIQRCSHAEFPKPTTRTGRPFQGPPFRYSLEWRRSPRYWAIPGHVGRTGTLVRPVAMTTFSDRQVPLLVVVSHVLSTHSTRCTVSPKCGRRAK